MIKRVCLDNLPKKGNSKKIDWKQSIGLLVPFVYDNIEGEIKIADYTSTGQKISLIFNDKTLTIGTTHFIAGEIGNLLNIITSDFKYEIGDIINGTTILNRKYVIKKRDKFVENQKTYEYKCNDCGYIGFRLEGMLHKRKCPCCSISPKVVVLGVNSISDTSPWMIQYVGEDVAKSHTANSNKKIIMVCPDCNTKSKNLIQINTLNNHGFSCKVCGDGISYPEKFLLSFLKQLNLKFQYQFSPKWCVYQKLNKTAQGKYDFYFMQGEQKYIIETDGAWHTKDNNMSGQTSKESIIIDKIKDDLANANDIMVIRIDCAISELKYIKNSILNSELVLILNLSNVDWIKCASDANKNIVKEVCKLWNDGVRNTKEISHITKLSRVTVTKYLKCGSEVLGICSYKPKLQRKIKIAVYNDQMSFIKLFNNMTELSNESLGLLGVKITIPQVSKAYNTKTIFKNYYFLSEAERYYERHCV